MLTFSDLHDLLAKSSMVWIPALLAAYICPPPGSRLRLLAHAPVVLFTLLLLLVGIERLFALSFPSIERLLGYAWGTSVVVGLPIAFLGGLLLRAIREKTP